MMVEPLKQLARLLNPAISGDGKALWLTIGTSDGDTADLAIQLNEIGHVVQFLISEQVAKLFEVLPKSSQNI